MTKPAGPSRSRIPKGPGSAQESQGGAAVLVPVRRFPSAAAPIRVARAVEGCIHCCGKCEEHPCRLRGPM